MDLVALELIKFSSFLCINLIVIAYNIIYKIKGGNKMVVKIVIGLITGTLLIGGLTFKKASDVKDYEFNRYEKIEQQINDSLK